MNRFEELNNRSIEWAKSKGIFEHGTDIGQASKTIEEANELFDAVWRKHKEDQIDAIGDILVCITIMAKRLNLDILDCFEIALNVIEARSGKMSNGQFFKDK